MEVSAIAKLREIRCADLRGGVQLDAWAQERLNQLSSSAICAQGRAMAKLDDQIARKARAGGLAQAAS
jgi:hypothetical protein